MNQIPSGPKPPFEGERVRLKGPRRTRTPAAREFARRLRKESTHVEKRLWRLLRGRHFLTFKFRREYPCGPYFLDFFCVEAGLAVELDGGGHGYPEQHEHDQARDRFIASRGIKTLRFWNHQVITQIESVRFEIWYALMERTGQTEKIKHYQTRPAKPPEATQAQRKRKATCESRGESPRPLGGED